MIITKLPGEGPTPSSEALKKLIANRLPEIELTALLIEVVGWTNFSRYFEHPSGNQPRSPMRFGTDMPAFWRKPVTSVS